jgi:hypothetical protein
LRIYKSRVGGLEDVDDIEDLEDDSDSDSEEDEGLDEDNWSERVDWSFKGCLILNVPSDIVPRSTVCFKEWGTAFKGLSDIIGRMEDFFSGVGVGIERATKVFRTVEIVGILEIVGEIVGAVEIGAASGAGVRASSCVRHGKTVSWLKWSKCSIKLLKGRITCKIMKKSNKRGSVIASLVRSWTRFHRSIGSTVISLREAIVVLVLFKARLGVSLKFSGSLRSSTCCCASSCWWWNQKKETEGL